MRGWRLKALLSESYRNAVLGGARNFIIVATLAFILAVAGLSESLVIQDLVGQERAIAVRGGYTLRVLPSSRDASGLNASRCEGLRAQGGVLASGAVLSSTLTRLTSAPGTQVRLVEISPGLVDTLKLRMPISAPGVAVGRELAQERGLGVGSRIKFEDPASRALVEADVRQVLPGGVWLEEAERGIVSVRVPNGFASSCYVSANPPAYTRLRGGELLGLASLSPSTPVISELVPRGTGRSLSDQYGTRVTRAVWVLGALVIAAVGELVRRSRRGEIALYRAIGTPPSSMVLMLMAEDAILAMLAAAVALQAMGFVWAAKAVESPAVRHGLRMALLTLLAGSLAQIPLVLAGARKRDLLAGLKDR